MDDTPERCFARFRDHGDAPALGAVFDRLAPELLLIAAHLAPAGIDAEDLVQTTFLEAIRSAARWDAERPLLPWLAGILVNHVHAERRRRARDRDPARLARASAANPVAGDDTPLHAAQANELAAELARVVAALPRHYRTVLRLRLAHGHRRDRARARVPAGDGEGPRAPRPRVVAQGVAGELRGRRRRRERAAGARRGARHGDAERPREDPAEHGGNGLVRRRRGPARAGVRRRPAEWRNGDEEGPRRRRGAGLRRRALVLRATRVAVGTVRGSRSCAAAARSPRAARRRRSERAVEPPRAGSRAAQFRSRRHGVGSHRSGLAGRRRARGARRGDRAFGRGRRHLLRARSDAAGVVVFTDLPPGTLAFGAPGGGKQELTIVAGAQARARVAVDPGRRLEGIVVDPAGQPAAAAHVCILAFGAAVDTNLRTLPTAADGTFRCAFDSDREYVWARKRGFAPSAYASLPRVGPTGVRLVLEPIACSVRGTVRTAAGAAAADALVVVVPHGRGGRPAPPHVLRTDAAGAFHTDELSAGAHVLLAALAGHAPARRDFTSASGENAVLDVELTHGGTVIGEVRDGSGTPRRTTVEARAEWAVGELLPLFDLCRASTKTAPDGSYRLEDLPPGGVVLWTGDRSMHAGHTVEVRVGEVQRCDFVVEDLGIHGRLVDPSGAPAAGWRVLAIPLPAGKSLPAETDAEGRFTVGGLEARPHEVRAFPWAKGVPFVSWATHAPVRPGDGELLLQLSHPLTDGATFRGRVVDSAGAPVPHALLLATRVGATMGSYRHDVVNGAFAYGPLPPARWAFPLAIPDVGNVDLGTYELLPRATFDVGTVRVPGRGQVLVRLSGANGEPRAPSSLIVHDGAGNADDALEPSGPGAWRSRPLPAGRYVVEAWGVDFAPVRQEVEIVAGAETPLALLTPRGAAVRFELLRPAGAAGGWRARARLTVRDTGGEPVCEEQVAVDGEDSFTLTRALPAGRYTCDVVLARDGGSGNATFTVADGGATVRLPLTAPAR